MIKVIPPNENDNGYNYEYEINGAKGTGYLTYDLMSDDKKRTLLLTSQTAILKRKGIWKNYEALRNQILFHQQRKSSFHTAKGIVNDMYTKDIRIDNTTIAVHKYGPVPVCVIPEVYELEFNGEKRQCKIAVYPYIKGVKSSKNIQSSIAFLQSLTFRLDMILTRYLEDIAENFFDIENHSDLTSAIKKARNSQKIIQESIDSKINIILSTTRGINNELTRTKGRLKRELLENNKEILFKVRYASLFASFFINKLYQALGFSFDDVEKEFRKLKLNNKNFNFYISRDSDLQLLRKSISNFHSNKGTLILENNFEGQTDTLWVKRFIKFSIFTHFINKENNLNPHIGKVFLSNQFTKPSSQLIKSKIEGLIDEQFRGKIQLVAVKEDQAGGFLDEIVKSTIWLSDSTYTALPKKVKKNYNWISKEAIHSESLNNQLLFILDKKKGDKSIEEFKNHLITINTFLSSNARNIAKSKERIIKKLENKLHARHSSEETNDIEFKKSLVTDIKKIIHFKVINTIDAWLSQFDPEMASIIIEANKKLIRPSKMAVAAKSIFGDYNGQEKVAFKKLWSKVKKRKLIINGIEYTLINKVGKTSSSEYKRNMHTIIKILLKDDLLIDTIYKRCLKLKEF